MAENGRVIVVGTGPAAASAAVFLARAGVETLLLETGSRGSPLGLTARVRGVTLGRKKPVLGQRQGLTMVGDPNAQLYEVNAPGGLSNQWSCAVPRFSPDDFTDAARAGEEQTWPIGYDDLAPWYDRVEPLLHIGGAAEGTPGLPAGKVVRALGLGDDWAPVRREAARRERDVVVMPYAYGGATTLTRAGTAFNAYTRLVKPRERAGLLLVQYDSRALRLEWSPRLRRVVAVILRNQKTGAEERLGCRGVVLGAGAVGSAQILLESASSDFPNGLGNAHGVLGRYFHDHPLGKLILDLGRPVSVHPATYVTRPTLSRSTPLYAAAFMQWSGTAALARSVLAGRPGFLTSIGFSVFGTMAPSRDDFIELDREKPREGGESALRMSLHHPKEATECLEQAKTELVEILNGAGWEARVRSWIVEPPGNSVHYGGTCRMHTKPELGVVDAFCRVHGVPNVAVADSGVFTTGPEKNPVLTAMTLAARAGDHLAEHLKRGDL
jgi:choline dehydrogenase-like flavoprotein